MRHAWLAATSLLLIALAPGLARAAAGQVSLLEGQAFRAPGGDASKRVALTPGAAVEVGDVVTTEAQSRLELTLADRSVLRLGPGAQAQITEAEFHGSARKLSAKLVLGQIWARVSSALGGDSKFEVATERAVAGVRGTTFGIDAHRDASVMVNVFAGAVAVAGRPGSRPLAPDAPASKGARKQVPGPHAVSRAEWEKIVGAQMRIVVAADGTPGEPERFAEADACQDAWTRWNRARDGEPCAP